MSAYYIRYMEPNRRSIGGGLHGYYAIDDNDQKITGYHATEDAAREMAEIALSKRAAQAPTVATPTAAVTPALDHAAARVSRMLGLDAPRATGRCHYCGLRLVGGYCEECV